MSHRDTRPSDAEREAVMAIARDLHRAGAEESSPDLNAAYTRMIESSFRAFMLRFREDMDRPMTEVEYGLARLAHCSGFVDGADVAFGIAQAADDELQPAAPRDGEEEGEG
jgi:hypothetical protein